MHPSRLFLGIPMDKGSGLEVDDVKWENRRRSSNVEDRRGIGGKTLLGGGAGGIILLLVIMFLGGDPTELIHSGLTGSQTADTEYVETEQEKELTNFVSVVLADTEDIWSEIFQENGMRYRNPKLVLYTGSVQSACGGASAAVGPFYCPGDEKLYIDLSFFDELKNQFQAPGDFAMAYVIAHEVGHHVQKQLGLSDQLDQKRRTLSKTDFNQYEVRFELQADYLAGVWAHHEQGKGYLEKGDIGEALNAAAQIGDDTLQKKAQGYAVPETFTHGTSEQRKRWLHRGFQYGDLEHGDTFGVRQSDL